MNFLACTSISGDGLSTSPALIKEGDCVIVYEGMNSMKAVYVTAKGRFENRFGVFTHQAWIGKPFGSKMSSCKGPSGWVLLLRPTPELWTQVLRHRTQILYLADISMIVTHLDLRPGSVVLESGTGSGSLTHSLIRAVAPAGHVHTFEFHGGRAEDAAAEFKQHGLSGFVTVTQRNIEELGFPTPLHGCGDAVFLDLPGPHKVVASAAACLRPNGRFCSFSPCIEQVQRTAEALSSAGFTDIITYECLLREYEVHRETLVTSLQLTDGHLAKRRKLDSTSQQQENKPTTGTASHQTAVPEEAVAAAVQQPATEDTSAEAAVKAKLDVNASCEGGGDVTVVGPLEAVAPSEPLVTDAVGARGGGCEVGIVGVSGNCGDGAPAKLQKAPAKLQQQQNQGPGLAGDASRQLRVVTCRPSLEARGHTGYLTIARKFVCG